MTGIGMEQMLLHTVSCPYCWCEWTGTESMRLVPDLKVRPHSSSSGELDDEGRSGPALAGTKMTSVRYDGLVILAA